MKEKKICPELFKNPWPTVGADPEFFIVTKKGTVINSDRFFPSEKDKLQVKATNFGEKSWLFFDGIQAEFNITEQRCREWILDDIWYIFKKVYDIIGPAYDISLQAAVKVRKDILKKADPRARIFGCDPDYDAYTGEENEIFVDPETHPLRYAGAHIHIGGAEHGKAAFITQQKKILESVKLLDILVGIPLVLLDRDVSSAIRRQMYGRAGCFRKTKWGIEYRTPSPYWLVAPEVASLVTGLVRLFYRIRLCKAEKYFTDPVDQDLVRHAIDYNDFDAAMEIYKAIKPSLIRASYRDSDPFNASGTDNYYGMGYINGAAMFEWLVVNGVEAVLGKTLKERWSLDVPYNKFDSHGDTAYGWYEGMWNRLEDNKKFRKYSKHFKKDTVNL